MPPHQIVPKMADQDNYIASESTLYRILKAEKLDAHRGRSKPKTERKKPEPYIAKNPNEIWSWDISVPQQVALRDGSRPTIVDLQGLAINHRKRHWLRAIVVSVTEKVHKCIRYGARRRTQVNLRSSVETTRWCQNCGGDVAAG